MGNTEPKVNNNRQVEVLHEKFKMVEVMQNMEEMILTIPYEQKSDINQWEKLLKNVRDCDPQFLLMPKKYMITEEGLCGSSGVIKIVYDCFTYSFEEQIRNHSEKFKYFQEAEIWYLLFAIISSVKQMDRLSMKVGDIRPHNIFVNENGQVKLAGVYSWPKEVENYLKTSYDKVVTYLAPEQLHQCRVGQKGKRSHILGESFSVGLTLLHTCLLKQMDDLYNLKKYQFNAEKLQYGINELRKLTFWNQQKGQNEKYSPELINIVIGLLELDESKRLSTLELFIELEPHAEEILNLRQFDIPKFSVATPTKDEPQSMIGSTNQPNRVSPPYSSIQKKQFNEAQSMAFDMNYGMGSMGVKEINTVKNSINIPTFVAERKTPEKRTTSKQKLRVSLSPEKVNLLAKTQPIQRENLSREKFNSNQQVNYSLPNTQVKNTNFDGNLPSTYQYTGEFKAYDIQQFQSFKPVINQNYVLNAQKRPQNQPFNYTTSNYIAYQPRYDIPPVSNEYRPLVQPAQLSYNQPQAPNFTYKPTVLEPQAANYPMTTTTNYPFTRNVEFTKSDYTMLQQHNFSAQSSHRPSYIGAGQQAGFSQTTNIYQISTVQPVVPGQMSFGINQGFVNESKTAGQQTQLLKKIDEQLNKSKQMYSYGGGL